MAPSRTSTVKSKHAASKSGVRNSKAASSSRHAVDDGVVKQRSAKSKRTMSKGVSLKQQRKVRTRTGDLPGKGIGDGGLEARLKKKFGKGRKVYTEKELGVPELNGIVPVGVQKPKGGKKGKVFVDDRESMMTILAMVNADKEGQIESKMMKARQMEEIREARRVEADKKAEERKKKFDETKEGLRKKRRRSAGDASEAKDDKYDKATKPLKLKKRVSFA